MQTNKLTGQKQYALIINPGHKNLCTYFRMVYFDRIKNRNAELPQNNYQSNQSFLKNIKYTKIKLYIQLR